MNNNKEIVGKLIEAINDFHKALALYNNLGIPTTWIKSDLELDDKCKLEIAFINYKELKNQILKKYCK